MWKAAYVASAAVVGASLIALPRAAYALGPIDVEGGAVAGGATNPSRGPNPFGVGIGARAGVGIRGLYLGLALTYYFGASGDCGGGAPMSGNGISSLPSAFCGLASGGSEVSLQQQAVLYGGDIGYTFEIPRAKFLKLRPLVQLGDAEITRTGTVGATDVTSGALRSENSFYLQPGLTVMITIESFFLGGDANVLILPNVPDVDGVAGNVSGTGRLTSSTRTFAAFSGHAQIGFRF